MARPTRQQLIERLQAEGLSPQSWSNGPGDRYPEHGHDFDKVLVAADGSITFHLREEGRDVVMAAGDRLDLPAGTRHAATVGPRGVTCLEAHLPAGAVPRPAAHRRDW